MSILQQMDKEQEFITRITPQVISLCESLISQIDDDYRVEGQDIDDDTPTMQLTIACDDSLESWTYQTGDNSFMGSCYHYPCWGTGYLTRDMNKQDIKETVKEMINEMLDQIYY